MAVSFVSSAAAESTSLTLPAHQAGDTILMFALRDSNAPVTTPEGWIALGNNAGLNSDNLTIGFKIASDASTVSGTWTDSDFLVSVVYRDDANYLIPSYRNGSRSTNGGTNSPSFPQKYYKDWITTAKSNSDRMQCDLSVVVGVVSSPSSSVDLSPPPSGMTNRIDVSGASSHRIAVHDTGSPVDIWTVTTTTLAGATPWITSVIELVDMGLPKSAASSSPRSPFASPPVFGV